MANDFKQVALSNVRYTPELHKALNISKEDGLVEKILSSNEVKEFRENNALDLEKIMQNNYADATTYTITIPVVTNDQNLVRSLIVYVNPESENITNKLLEIKTNITDSTVTYVISDLDGTNLISTTLDENMNKVGGDEAVQPQGFVECIEEEFKGLPWWLQAACGGSCGACFGLNPAACAVCAGCIGGNARFCL